jgi:hypothetical protein
MKYIIIGAGLLLASFPTTAKAVCTPYMSADCEIARQLQRFNDQYKEHEQRIYEREQDRLLQQRYHSSHLPGLRGSDEEEE